MPLFNKISFKYKDIAFVNLFLHDLYSMSYFRNLSLPGVHKHILYFIVKFLNFALPHLSLYNLPGIYICVRYSYYWEVGIEAAFSSIYPRILCILLSQYPYPLGSRNPTLSPI